MLLELDQQRHFGLDDVGGRAWCLLSEAPETDRLVTVLLSEYEVEESQLRNDLRVLIDRLASAGLVKLDP